MCSIIAVRRKTKAVGKLFKSPFRPEVCFSGFTISTA